MLDSQRHAAGRTWHPARVRPLAIGDKLARLCLAGQARTGLILSPPQKLRSGFPPNALPCADIPSARIHQPSPLPTYADLPNRRDTASACANTSSLVAPMRPFGQQFPLEGSASLLLTPCPPPNSMRVHAPCRRSLCLLVPWPRMICTHGPPLLCRAGSPLYFSDSLLAWWLPLTSIPGQCPLTGC
jgi:hypothetical protein